MVFEGHLTHHESARRKSDGSVKLEPWRVYGVLCGAAGAAPLAGLRNLSVIRSLSPIASNGEVSKPGLSSWPKGEVRNAGGNDQTPNGWSRVSRALALRSLAATN